MGGDAGGGVEGADTAIPVPGSCLHPAGRDAGRDSGLAVERGRDTLVEDENDAVDEGTEQRGLQVP